MKARRNIFETILKPFIIVSSLMLATACGRLAVAQSAEGSISGTVSDTSGAVVPGAKIAAVGASTGSRYETTSTSSGLYRIPAMNVGTYNLTVTASGFQASVNSGVVVQVGTIASLNVRLNPGSEAQTVTVTANAPRLQTESSEVGTVVTERQVLDLPLSAGSGLREPQAFVFLAPGTAGPGTAGGSGGAAISKITGGQNYGSSVLLDGLDTYVDENGSNIVGTEPSVEALSEFKVLTSTLPAEYGRTTGGVASFSVKSGTNNYHGEAYELFRNTGLDANTWFNNAYGAMNPANASIYRRPVDNKNDYGATFGGPIRIPHVYDGKNKSFFFFSWEQYRQNLGAVITSTVPTLAERSGDFSAIVNTNQVLAANNPCTKLPIYAGQIFNPATTRTVNGVECRDQFPGNKIPSSSVSNMANQVLSLYPPPTNSSLNNNYSRSSINPIIQTTYTLRIDQNVSQKSKLFFDYTARKNTSRANTSLPAPIGFGADEGNFRAHFTRVGWDYSFTPTLLNNLVLGYNRWINQDTALATLDNKDWPAAIGIGNVHAQQFPQMSFGEVYPQLGYPIDVNQIDDGLRAGDSLTWIKGKHTLEFGADWRYQEWSPSGFEGQAGYFNWTRAQTAGTNTSATLSGNGFASFLLGSTASANLAVRAVQPQFRQPYIASYVQDDYKILPSLMLNLGFRWDVDVPRHELHGYASTFDPTVPNPAAGDILGGLRFAGVGPGKSGNNKDNFIGTYYKDFAPRVGFSWQPWRQSNLVFRGGYGILYGGLLYSDHGNNLLDGYNAYPSVSSPDGYKPAFSIDSGFPGYTPPPIINPSAANYDTSYGGVSYLAAGVNRPAMVQNWTLQSQIQVASDLIFTLGYIGMHSTRLRSGFDPTNDLPESKFALGSLLKQPVSSSAAQAAGIKAPFSSFYSGLQVAQALVPYPQYYTINTDCCGENYGQSTYNALQATIERRFQDGLSLLGAYTWEKTLTDADSALPAFENYNGGGGTQDAAHKQGDKSVSYQDIPQTLVVSYLYEIPVGKEKKFLSKGGVTNALVGGWQIGGVDRYQSGQPYVFCCGTGIPAYDAAIRFNRVQGQPLESAAKRSGHFNVLTDQAFNAAAFQDPNSTNRISAGGAYEFGDMPRVTGEVRSNRYLNEDMSLIKRTQLTEGIDLNFHVDAFDVFNRHVFNHATNLTPFGPSYNQSTNSFGLINSTINGPRSLQLQLKLEF